MSTLFAMKRDFEAHGVKDIGWTQLLEGEHLIEFCRQYRPDVVIEMNRARNQVSDMPVKILHVSWIVDQAGRSLNDYRDSNILYVFNAARIHEYTERSQDFIDWVTLAICHIPLPWNQNELDRVIHKNQVNTVKFKDLGQACFSDWEKVGILRKLELGGYLESIDNCLQRLTGESKIEIEDKGQKFDVMARNGRLFNRYHLIKSVLSITDSLLFGSINRQKWPNFRDFYKIFLDNPHDIRRDYQTSHLYSAQRTRRSWNIFPDFRLYWFCRNTYLSIVGLGMRIPAGSTQCLNQINIIFRLQKRIYPKWLNISDGLKSYDLNSVNRLLSMFIKVIHGDIGQKIILQDIRKCH